MRKRAAFAAGPLALAALCLGSPVHAAAPASTDAPSDVQAPAALSVWDKLAGVAVGYDNIHASTDRMLDAMIGQIAKAPDFVELEQSFPGLTAAMAEALRPVMHDEVVLIMPQYRAELSALYARSLTAEEAGEALRAMSGEPMKRFREQIAASRSVAAMVRDITAQQEVSSASLSSDVRSSAMEAMLQMDPADVAAINGFFRSPLGVKLGALNPAKLAIDQKWANTMTPGGEKRMQVLIVEAMTGHIAKTDPKLAKTMRKAMRKEFASDKDRQQTTD
jgi:hypothetical protein